MEFFRRHRYDILLSFLILGSYLITRLIRLTSMPIFTDEAIYLRWAQIAKNDANWRFISLTDGKQPLFVWLTMGLMRFIHDPLVAGRMVSVGAGLLSVIGLFFLSIELFKSKWIGYLSAIIYVILPFSLIYDRMAMYDSLVGTFAVWGLFFTVLLVRRLRLDVALMMGFVTGAAVLNKTSGFFTIYLLPFSVILFDWKKKMLKNRLMRFIGLSLVVVILTYVFYAILRLSPFYYIINEKNGLFVYPFREWIRHPFLGIIPNIRSLADWYLSYIGIPFTILALASFFLSTKYFREKALLFLWFILPFTALIIFGKQLYPRYILFMTLSLIPLIASSIYFLLKTRKSSLIRGIVLILAFAYSVTSFFLILLDPLKAPIPQADKGQYLAGWPAGVGITESTAFFKQQAAQKDIVIATEGTFGLLPYAYELYLIDNPHVKIKGYWPTGATIPAELLQEAKTKQVYAVFYQECPSCPGKGLAPVTWPVKQILQMRKAEPNTFLTVYQVMPQ